jgi:hypothetical protein
MLNSLCLEVESENRRGEVQTAAARVTASIAVLIWVKPADFVQNDDDVCENAEYKDRALDSL